MTLRSLEAIGELLPILCIPVVMQGFLKQPFMSRKCDLTPTTGNQEQLEGSQNASGEASGACSEERMFLTVSGGRGIIIVGDGGPRGHHRGAGRGVIIDNLLWQVGIGAFAGIGDCTELPPLATGCASA